MTLHLLVLLYGNVNACHPFTAFHQLKNEVFFCKMTDVNDLLVACEGDPSGYNLCSSISLRSFRLSFERGDKTALIQAQKKRRLEA